jgi:carbon monoxide dehydrogenase subunit G
MIKIDSSTQVARPRDEVFAFLTDIENIPRWQSGVVQSRPISEGPFRVGYQYRETVKAGPWKLSALCTVTDVKPNERFTFVMTSDGPLDCEARFDLQPVAGGTRVTVQGTARLKGVWRLLQPMMASELRKETKAELETLRRLLESDRLREAMRLETRA